MGYASSQRRPQGMKQASHSSSGSASRAALMQDAIDHPTIPSEATDGIAAAALRAEAWAGEPFVRPGEDAVETLKPETALRRALDEALGEIDAGRAAPSNEWKVRFGLMLGLRRVLGGSPPRLLSGTELRRHQIDALQGMLDALILREQFTELIEAGQEPLENGNGAAEPELEVEVEVEA